MSNKIAMRDAFFNQVYELAKKDREVVIVDADMGAPSLDKYRRDFPERFVRVGIAEHNMIAVASGLAKEGKKVFTFAIAPFTTSRCHEFIKLNAGLMKIPINIVGCGTGFSYDDSGPTHHTTEDISIMRPIPHLEILSPSDSKMAEKFANISYNSPNPTYIRLDRKVFPDIFEKYYKNDNLRKGFKELEQGDSVAIVSTGNMVHRALEVREHYKNEKIGVIDLYRLKPLNSYFKDALSKYKKILSLEEHILDGGLGSIISETITDNHLPVRLKRIGLNDYYYLYGRENIHKKTGLNVSSIIAEIKKL